MPAIGKKLWEPVARLAVFESCDGHRLATLRGYFRKRSDGSGSEQDGSVPVSGASDSGSRIGQRLRRAAHDINTLQFAVGKVSDRRAVGRPEWIASSIRSRQWLCGERIQWPDPELRFAVVRSRKHQPPTIG